MRKPSRWRRLAVLVAALAPFAAASTAAASTVDVSLQVTAPGEIPPHLALTGFPMLLLLALVAVLVGAGLLLMSAGRDRAEAQTGKGS